MTYILVIEDERYLLEDITEVLQYTSFTVQGANNGVQGVELALKNPPDLIICDIMMPGMNGAQLLTEARHLDHDAVALVMSVQADLESTITAVNEAGLFGFLTKPCPPQILTNALDRAIAQHHLVISERQLLERTVRGSVDMLTELMAGTAPLAFAATQNNRALVLSAIATLPGEDRRARLLAALEAYDRALEHYRPDTAPLD